MAIRRAPVTDCGSTFPKRLQPYFAEVDASAEIRLDRLAGVPWRGDLDLVAARILVELVELEVAVVVARHFSDRAAVPGQANACSLHAIDRAIRLRCQCAADEAFRIAPEIAVIDPRLGAGVRLHHLQSLLARH